jgi:hypothetical protein
MEGGDLRSYAFSMFPRSAKPWETPEKSWMWKVRLPAVRSSSARCREGAGKVWSVSAQERKSGPERKRDVIGKYLIFVQVVLEGV